MTYEPDVYNNPEKFGLEIVYEANDPQASYDYQDLVLWRHKETGALYYSESSGCSCSSPFEDCTSLADLDVLDDSPGSWETFAEAVKNWCEYDLNRPSHQTGKYAVIRTEMLRRAAAAL